MFCPQCGTETLEQLKFCKRCGTNLRRVQGVMSKGGAGILLHHEMSNWERDAFEEHLERRKRSPEEKRYSEIKAGVITSSVGLGVLIFLGILFTGIASNINDPMARDVLFAIRFVGIIPFLVGLGIIINGLFVSKRIVEFKREKEQEGGRPSLTPIANTSPVPQLVDSTQSQISDFSIAEPTTRALQDPVPIPSTRDTN